MFHQLWTSFLWYLFYSPAQFNDYSQAGFEREGDDFLILPSSAELSVLQSCIDRLSIAIPGATVVTPPHGSPQLNPSVSGWFRSADCGRRGCRSSGTGGCAMRSRPRN